MKKAITGLCVSAALYVVTMAAAILLMFFVVENMDLFRVISLLFAFVSFTVLFVSLVLRSFFKSARPDLAPAFSVLSVISVLYFLLEILLLLILIFVLESVPETLFIVINSCLTGLAAILYGICLIGAKAIAKADYKTKTQLANILFFNEEIEHFRMKTDKMPKKLRAKIRFCLDDLKLMIRKSSPNSIGDVAQYDLVMKEGLVKLGKLVNDICVSIDEDYDVSQLTEEFNKTYEELRNTIYSRKNRLSSLT